jgi:hypothetical protein
MAKKSRQTLQKREKERARAMRQKDKEIRRLEAKERKSSITTAIGDEDPDIAGIRPGPQPLPEQWNQDSNSSLESSEET